MSQVDAHADRGRSKHSNKGRLARSFSVFSLATVVDHVGRESDRESVQDILADTDTDSEKDKHLSSDSETVSTNARSNYTGHRDSSMSRFSVFSLRGSDSESDENLDSDSNDEVKETENDDRNVFSNSVSTTKKVYGSKKSNGRGRGRIKLRRGSKFMKIDRLSLAPSVLNLNAAQKETVNLNEEETKQNVDEVKVIETAMFKLGISTNSKTMRNDKKLSRFRSNLNNRGRNRTRNLRERKARQRHVSVFSLANFEKATINLSKLSLNEKTSAKPEDSNPREVEEKVQDKKLTNATVNPTMNETKPVVQKTCLDKESSKLEEHIENPFARKETKVDIKKKLQTSPFSVGRKEKTRKIRRKRPIRRRLVKLEKTDALFCDHKLEFGFAFSTSDVQMQDTQTNNAQPQTNQNKTVEKLETGEMDDKHEEEFVNPKTNHKHKQRIPSRSSKTSLQKIKNSKSKSVGSLKKEAKSKVISPAPVEVSQLCSNNPFIKIKSGGKAISEEMNVDSTQKFTIGSVTSTKDKKEIHLKQVLKPSSPPVKIDVAPIGIPEAPTEIKGKEKHSLKSNFGVKEGWKAKFVNRMKVRERMKTSNVTKKEIARNDVSDRESNKQKETEPMLASESKNSEKAQTQILSTTNYVEAVRRLFLKNQYSEITVICDLVSSKKPNDKLQDILVKTLFKLGYFGIARDMFLKYKPSEDSIVRWDRASKLVNKIEVCIGMSSDNDLEELGNLKKLKTHLRELKGLSRSSMVHDIYYAFYLVRKLAYLRQKCVGSTSGSSNQSLIEKLKSNVVLCIDTWFNLFPNDVRILFLSRSLTQYSIFAVFKNIVSLIEICIKNSWLEDVHIFTTKMVSVLDSSPYMQSICNNEYLNFDCDSVNSFARETLMNIFGDKLCDQVLVESRDIIEIHEHFNVFKTNILKVQQRHSQITSVVKLKLEAKSFFLEQKFKKSLMLYTCCLDLKFMTFDELFESVRSVLLNNRAACQMYLSNFQAALDDCTQALEIDKNNHKAQVRKAKALTRLRQFEEAMRELKSLEGTEAFFTLNVTKEMANVLQSQERYLREKQQEARKRFFENERTPRPRTQPQAKKGVRKSTSKSRNARESELSRLLAETDLYKLFSVSSNSDVRLIKRKYHKLALKYHPDKVKKSNTNRNKYEEIFKKISSGFQVLSDPLSRRKYDLSRRLDTSSYQRSTHSSQSKASYNFRGTYHSKFYNSYNRSTYRTRARA